MLALIIFISVLLAMFLSTYGWRFWGQAIPTAAQPQETQLSKRLQTHVYKLSHDIGDRSVYKYDQLNQAADYITEQLKSYGYNVEFQHYTALNKFVKNIIVSKPGETNSKDVIVVGAHYDTCDNPGADDNASAVAGLLELAHTLKNQHTPYTIKFVAFTCEEPPFFKTNQMGSRVYAKAAKEKGENIKAAFILEMIGYYSNQSNTQRYPPLFGFFYPNKGNFISIVGNFKSRRLVKNIVSLFKNHSTFPIESIVTFPFVPGVDFSDNWSFWKAGYPAIMITDTAFYRNPNYHRSTDTHEKLDYTSMAEVIKGLRGALTQLDYNR